jgi:hypothetical protein
MAYAAGVLDSDGSLGAYMSGPNRLLKLVITVAVLDARLPEWLEARWGGNTSRFVDNRDNNARPLWRWQIQGRKSRGFVSDLLPYLVIKGEQANLYLRLCDTVTKGGYKVTPDTRELREELAAELKRLKWV